MIGERNFTSRKSSVIDLACGSLPCGSCNAALRTGYSLLRVPKKISRMRSASFTRRPASHSKCSMPKVSRPGRPRRGTVMPDGHHEEKFFYFVDGVKYETDQETVTGALIKAKIPNFDPSYGLFLETAGGGPDQPIY